MSDLRFKPRGGGAPVGWTCHGQKFGSPEQMASIKEILAKDGPILVEHKILFGGCGPRTLTFDDFEAFESYVSEEVYAGDKISIWNLWPFMRDTNPIAHGKCPTEDGLIPEGGAY